MKTNIVCVKYEDSIYKKTFSGREYSYYTIVPLKKGDIVIAPTKNGISNALVTSVDVPKEKIESIKDVLKTITIKMNKELFLKNVSKERMKNYV